MRDEGKKPEDLKTRTKAFALRIIKLFVALPKRTEAQVVGKIQGGLQELEETQYWLELLAESGTVPEDRLSSLLQEADELTAILVTCVKKVKARKK